MGIIIIVILVIAFLIWTAVKVKESQKEKQKERQRKAYETIKESHENFDRLCKSELVQLLHEKMYAKFNDHMRWQVNYYLNTYKTKPENVYTFIYADKWVNDNSAIWARGISDDYRISGSEISFRELGYQNLSQTHQGQLIHALAKYSKAWVIKYGDNQRYELVYNKDYWYPYIQSYIEKECKARNIKELKTI